MKVLAKILIGACLVFFIFSLAHAAAPAQDYYTKVNIWYENPEKILSTNYHRGAIIPYGSKIAVTKIVKEKIHFTVEDMPGMTFILSNIPRHSLVNAQTLVKQYFSETNPKAQGGEFDKFNPKEKENILAGTITKGMSKEAVVAAYGIPPKHKTPSLVSNLWNYWETRFVRKQLTFTGNLITNIEEITETLEGPHIYYAP